MSAKQLLKRVLMGTLARKEKIVVPALEGSFLEGRRAFITGGTGGIGFAIAKAFLSNGASVCVTGRDVGRLEDAVTYLGTGAHGIVLDCTHINQFPAALDQAEHYFGSACDILVNNAGILAGGPFSDITQDVWQNCIDTNLRSAYFLSQEFSRRLITSGGQPFKVGNILNVASSSSLRPALTPYSISKWGIRGMTLGLAKVLAPHGIVVNGVAPGPTATPMLMGEDNSNLDLPASPVGRYATPEEVANVSVVLTSSMGDMIIGDIVYMTGGAGLTTFDDTSYTY